MKFYGIHIITTFLIVLLSCNRQKQYDSSEIWINGIGDNSGSAHNKNIEKDIPVITDGRFIKAYYDKKIVETKMGMRTLENGFDSLQIRIWYGHVFTDKHQLLIIKKNLKKWEAYFGLVTIKSDGNSILSVTKVIKEKKPKSGWIDFINKLYATNILNLQDYHKIPDYELCNDGDGVTIEVATAGMYRIYNYPCFTEQHHIAEADSIEKIMRLIEFEFDFNRLRP